MKEIAIKYFKCYSYHINIKSENNKIFDFFDHFRILCALRRGPYGVEEINRLIERILVRPGLYAQATPGIRDVRS